LEEAALRPDFVTEKRKITVNTINMKIRLYSTLSILAAGVVGLIAGPALTPMLPVNIVGAHGAFDFTGVDPVHRHLLLCHADNDSLDVVNLDTSTLIQSIPLGAAQGVAVDTNNNRYYVSISTPPGLVTVDASSLKVIATLPLPEETDLIGYHPGLNRVYVCNRKKPEVWVVDPVTQKILATIHLPGGGMEELCFDASGKFLFQGIRNDSHLAKVDLSDNTVLTNYSTMPIKAPHGIVRIPGSDVALIAGKNGISGLVSLETGKVIATTVTPTKIDQLAYDADLHQAYAVSSSGSLVVMSINHDQLTTVTNIPCAPGADGISVDPKNHSVWIAYDKDGKSYFQKFEVDAARLPKLN